VSGVLSTRARDAGYQIRRYLHRNECSPRARGMRGEMVSVQPDGTRALHARAGCGIAAEAMEAQATCSPRARGMRGNGQLSKTGGSVLSTRARDADCEGVPPRSSYGALHARAGCGFGHSLSTMRETVSPRARGMRAWLHLPFRAEARSLHARAGCGE